MTLMASTVASGVSWRCSFPVHPFTAPAVSPRTSCFSKRTSSTNRGRKASTIPTKATLKLFSWLWRGTHPDLQGPQPVILGDDQRPEVLVESPEEAEESQGGNRRPARRGTRQTEECPMSGPSILGRPADPWQAQKGLARNAPKPVARNGTIRPG